MSLSGKLEFFGGWQLALLTVKTESSRRVPCRVIGSRTPLPRLGGDPWRGLDTAGWRLQYKAREQGKTGGRSFHGEGLPRQLAVGGSWARQHCSIKKRLRNEPLIFGVVAATPISTDGIRRPVAACRSCGIGAAACAPDCSAFSAK